MSKQFANISDRHIAFIEKQKIFFVATAAPEGRVNVSPKGMESLKVLGENKVIWLNYTGSGNETAAHLLESSRMTLMFCAFEGSPEIVRLYGSATAIHCEDEKWQEYIAQFEDPAGARQIFLLDVDLVQSSCGMSVPLYDYVQERNDLKKWHHKRTSEELREYWKKKNSVSIDGKETHIAELINKS